MLRSWKEIASYLQVGVRTAQRWERERALPVHRPEGEKSRPVAYTGELDDWLTRTGPRAADIRLPARFRVKLFLGALLALGLTLVIAVVVSSLLAGRPVRGVVEAGKLKVFDEEGALCWEKELDVQARPQDWLWTGLAFDTAVVADADADGRNEVLFNLMPGRGSGVCGRLICFEQDGEKRWEYSYGRAIQWQGRTYDAKYIGRFVCPFEVRGRRYILTVASHAQWFPAQVALIDPADGKLIEEYWHPGAICRYLIEDLDDDGADEVLLGAINNPGPGLGHAALAVLKVPFSRVAAKPEPEAVFTGTREYAYLLFPRPDTSSLSGTLPVSSDLAVINGNQIMLKIETAESGGLFYYLNFALELEDLRFSDNFPALHRRYRLMGLLDHDWNEAEVASLREVRRFSAAPNANSPEVDRLWEGRE